MRQRFISRHRLEKRDPNAAVSEAVKPIVYYVDRGAPEPIRSALLEGARWWNQAFEAAGFRNGFRVELMPEGADPMDVRYNIDQLGPSIHARLELRRGDYRSAHGRDHQGPRLARLAARAAGLPDRRRPALAVHERHGDGRSRSTAAVVAPHAPARRARGRATRSGSRTTTTTARWAGSR